MTFDPQSKNKARKKTPLEKNMKKKGLKRYLTKCFQIRVGILILINQACDKR
jgi:hypothetical protein